MPRSTKSRRWVFLALTIVSVVVVIEAFSAIAYRISTKEWPSFSALSEERSRIVETSNDEADPVTDEVDALRMMYTLHPYLGYVMSPDPKRLGTNWFIRARDPEAPFVESPDAIHVVIAGGSVAFNLRVAQARLREGLREHEAFRDKKIVLVNLAGLGYKQPQSLLAVSYYLALGGKIDVLICLDGINEIAIAASNVIENGIYPHYPAPYSMLARGFDDPAVLARYVEVKALRARRARVAAAFERVGFGFTANLLWKLIDTRIGWQIYELHAESEADAGALPLHSRGPEFDAGPDGSAARAEIARLWARSSRVLAELGRAHGFAYFHFLQPSQYAAEAQAHLSTVDRERHATRESLQELIPRWYPELQRLGAELSEEGVAFYDMTSVHEGFTGTAYSDDCCHLSREGREVLVEAMTDRIVERLRSEASPRAPL